MRTTGTFRDVYQVARGYYAEIDVEHCPMDPVVRRVNGEWRIESGIHDEPDADCECSLEAFDTYFYEVYRDSAWLPTDDDVNEFAEFSRLEECEDA